MTAQTGGVGRRSGGFFRSLVDLSFTSFVTARVVKFIYVLSVIFVVLYALFATLSLVTFAGGFASALAGSRVIGIVAGTILFVLLAPVVLLVGVTYVRVLLEIVIVLFRISENTAEMTGHLRRISERDRSDYETRET